MCSYDVGTVRAKVRWFHWSSGRHHHTCGQNVDTNVSDMICLNWSFQACFASLASPFRLGFKALLFERGPGLKRYKCLIEALLKPSYSFIETLSNLKNRRPQFVEKRWVRSRSGGGSQGLVLFALGFNMFFVHGVLIGLHWGFNRVFTGL